TPANILYQIQVLDQSTGQRTSGLAYTMQAVVGVTGSTWALDHYGPPAQTSAVSALQATQGTALPSVCVAPSVFTLYNTGGSFLGFYTCVGGTEVAISSGSTGPTGPTGATGLTGATGSAGTAGTAATVAVGTTTTLAAGASATATNVGTSSAAVINFGIP